MLLTISTTMSPATDLGYLLHKHPDRVQTFDQAFGTAHVFYPDADAGHCTAALLLEVDSLKLAPAARRGGVPEHFTLGQYVNDRPYAASSLLASAMAGIFRTAMRGRCDARPELAQAPIPLRLHLPALPCRGGAGQAAALFEPLGWGVDARPVPLDEEFPDWGDSRYVALTLTGRVRLADALNHLYVLLPVLDSAKHYWIAPDEVDKLIRAGEGWLAAHPERARITRRYLANRHRLVRTALARLAEADDTPDDALERDPIDEEPPVTDPTSAAPGAPDTETEPGTGFESGAASPPVPLAERRVRAILDVLHAERTPRVADLGCGSGRLLDRLKRDGYFQQITGVDVSARAVKIARRGVPSDEFTADRLPRIQIFQGSVTYADERFRDHDAAVLMEVIEHIDPPRLPTVTRVVFGDARPRVVVVTTPNVEHNVRYEGLAPGALRHSDHRFEWTRAEFRRWAGETAAEYGYQVRFVAVGDDDPEVGPPTQMGVFTR